jgi:hypothetical protein
VRTILYCLACDGPIGESDYRTNKGDRFGLCLACFEKVVRGGRTPKQVIEALLIFLNDPNVGGPDDTLDHEDYRDMELLGLWPEKADD